MSKFNVYDFVVADRDMVARGKGYSFRSYTDKIGKFGHPGSVVIYDDGTKDKSNRPVGKSFSVNQSHYKLIAREGQKDYDDKSLVEFFKYAPFCLGSPNGEYEDAEGNPVNIEEVQNISNNLVRIKSGELKQLNVKIKLMDDELDAKMALETGIKRAEAQISAGQIDEQILSEVAALIGVFNKPEKSMRLAVYEFAGKRPLDYFKHLESGDRSIRAVIRKGIADSVLHKKGDVIYWDQTVMGADENSVVSTLLNDKAMLDSLKAKLDLKSSDKKAKAKK
jgi:hypothetical protein